MLTFFENYLKNITLIQQTEFFIRIIVAGICGAFIGLERTRRFKEAGVRTHILVASASALLMVVSKYGFADLQMANEFLAGTKGGDPSRIASQVISGISFLGAGVIFRYGASVKGLTTAAGIWATSGIGLAVGAGMYLEGIFVTIVVIGSQLAMHKITLGKDSVESITVNVTVIDSVSFRRVFEEHITKSGGSVTYLAVNKNQNDTITYKISLVLSRRHSISELVLECQNDENVVSFSASPSGFN